jgi:hypothetical protein
VPTESQDDSLDLVDVQEDVLVRKPVERLVQYVLNHLRVRDYPGVQTCYSIILGSCVAWDRSSRAI